MAQSSNYNPILRNTIILIKIFHHITLLSQPLVHIPKILTFAALKSTAVTGWRRIYLAYYESKINHIEPRTGKKYWFNHGGSVPGYTGRVSKKYSIINVQCTNVRWRTGGEQS